MQRNRRNGGSEPQSWCSLIVHAVVGGNLTVHIVVGGSLIVYIVVGGFLIVHAVVRVTYANRTQSVPRALVHMLFAHCEFLPLFNLSAKTTMSPLKFNFTPV